MTDLVTRIAEQVRYQYMPAETRAVLDEAASLLRSQAEEIARLRKAVEPFAAAAVKADKELRAWSANWATWRGLAPDDQCLSRIKLGWCRRARAAINRSGEP